MKKEIGGLRLSNGLWLAPLAGVTTSPLRELFTRLGAGLTHTEMVSCMGLVRKNRKTEGMLRILPGEGSVVLQLFDGDAAIMARGAEMALEKGSFAALGINMACPMPKVVRRGAGAALLKNPDAAFEMTGLLKRLGLPVWVKIRRIPLYKCESLEAEDACCDETLRFVELLLDAGADNVCIHGRTPAQRYEGRADRSVVAAAARRFPGKISGSGDVYAVDDVLEYINAGCVGVMAARGALADPWLFPRALKALGYNAGQSDPLPAQRIGWLRDLGARAAEVCGPRPAAVLLKRLAGGMLKGMPGAADLRRRLGMTSDAEGLLEILESASQM